MTDIQRKRMMFFIFAHDYGIKGVWLWVLWMWKGAKPMEIAILFHILLIVKRNMKKAEAVT